MNNYIKFVFIMPLLVLMQSGYSVASPRQAITFPSIDEMASAFTSPPVAYGMTFYWGWDGNVIFLNMGAVKLNF